MHEKTLNSLIGAWERPAARGEDRLGMLLGPRRRTRSEGHRQCRVITDLFPGRRRSPCMERGVPDRHGPGRSRPQKVRLENSRLASIWNTHTPILVDVGIVLSTRALPDKYRQLNPSSRSHLYSFSLMISVSSFSPHLSLRIPAYAPLSLGWSPTHQVPSMSFHDCVFDSSGRACAADVTISSAAMPANTVFFTRRSGNESNRALALPCRWRSRPQYQ